MAEAGDGTRRAFEPDAPATVHSEANPQAEPQAGSGIVESTEPDLLTHVADAVNDYFEDSSRDADGLVK